MFIALRLLLLFTLLLGAAYPLALAGLSGVLFPKQAAGDPELVGRHFEGEGYFWSRPSATPEKPYNAALSSGSNWGPREPRLGEQRAAALQRFAGLTPPEDLLTASGSGLDPHITPEAARFQKHGWPAPGASRRSACGRWSTACVSRPPWVCWATTVCTSGA